MIQLDSEELVALLESQGVTTLYHANTLPTSLTFLQKRALLSRQYVEENGLMQTAQISDATDKLVGIWNCIFFDQTDIHDQSKRVNYYGPVMFAIPVALMNEQPNNLKIGITKSNPKGWTVEQTLEQQWFESVKSYDDYAADLLRDGKYPAHTNFGHHVVLDSPVFAIDPRIEIILDDPQKESVEYGYNIAALKLEGAMKVAGLTIPIKKRQCPDGCKCSSHYR